ncbi:hypothetical protein LTR22_026250 [Elasticomyces elasticus]|nr:hypothetical protein LTR22_026250 [Elasticomyces elasticus]
MRSGGSQNAPQSIQQGVDNSSNRDSLSPRSPAGKEPRPSPEAAQKRDVLLVAKKISRTAMTFCVIILAQHIEMAVSLLSNEIWQRIFTFAANDDKVTLWLNGRRACKLWKCNIERTYCDHYLKDAACFAIGFDCGIQKVPDTGFGGRCFLAVEMIFDRADHGRGAGFCVFGENSKSTGQPPDLGNEKWGHICAESKYSTWQRNIDGYLGNDTGGLSPNRERFDRPPWAILLSPLREDEYGYDEYLDVEHDDTSEILNDTELPGFSYDIEKREISFDWILAFSKLFAEAAELTRRDELSHRSAKNNVLLNVGRLNSKGDIVPRDDVEPRMFTAFLLKSVRIAKGGSRENRKQIRRERIKRSFKERHDFDYDYRYEGFVLHEREALRQFAPTGDPFSLLTGRSMEDEEYAGEDDAGELSSGEHRLGGISSRGGTLHDEVDRTSIEYY